uniref:Uncharacterized protein n=1 Tax=Oryza rufipogon TaxID=4529 RepID=A0A0E0Q8H9_ORYRU
MPTGAPVHAPSAVDLDHAKMSRRATSFPSRSSPKYLKISQYSSTGDGDCLRLLQLRLNAAVADSFLSGEHPFDLYDPRDIHAWQIVEGKQAISVCLRRCVTVGRTFTAKASLTAIVWPVRQDNTLRSDHVSKAELAIWRRKSRATPQIGESLPFDDCPRGDKFAQITLLDKQLAQEAGQVIRHRSEIGPGCRGRSSLPRSHFGLRSGEATKVKGELGE